jgi:hypothetical protein
VIVTFYVHEHNALCLQCLRKFSSMSPVELRAKYGFSDTYIAEHLVTRSAGV